MPPLRDPLSNAKFTLDASAVAGFFGGETAISAMTTIHLYHSRRWLGWYNSPGSYQIAMCFGRLANSRFWDAVFPGPNKPPEISFGLDGQRGPTYIGVLSGTEMQTGHLAYLTMQKIKETTAEEINGNGRITTPGYVALLDLGRVTYEGPVPQEHFRHALCALFPITVSVVTCLVSGMINDWYCASMILLGIISSGLASFVIGSGKLYLKTNNTPAPGAPAGDGILVDGNTALVIRGEEKDVNAITKGSFELQIGGKPTYHQIGMCSLVLIIQFLLQLLLIPQGSLFGQIMFVTSLAVSWMYNSYLSSLEKEMIQVGILFQKLGRPTLKKFRLGTRTKMAVFACLLVCSRGLHGTNPGKILQHFIPNDTPVWQRWREKVLQKMNDTSRSESLKLDQDDLENFDEAQRTLLTGLLDDADDTFKEFHERSTTSLSRPRT
ncbi:hypothetical protein BU15DRAFT_50429 [Melanogaster broomeanus]|nr:hypothetical protein BU15DRAFT_50429 [Melanogaster broomeanus]